MNDAHDARVGFQCALLAGAVLLTWSESHQFDLDGPAAWLVAAVANWAALFVVSVTLFLLVPLVVPLRDALLRRARRPG